MSYDILDDVLTLGRVLPVMDKPAESIADNLILPLCLTLSLGRYDSHQA